MLDTGNVYILTDFHNSGTEPHYQIVVHKTAANELVVVYLTSKVDKAKLRCMRDNPKTGFRDVPATYVEIPEGTCESLPELCAVNCDKAFLSTIEDREAGLNFSKMEHKLPKEFLDKIAAGIRESFVVPQNVIDALDR